jgi:predicted nucleic acid-binding protein
VTGFLVDTNVLSEARKASRANPRVVAWIAAHRDDLFLSVLVTGEIRRGIESVRARDPAAAASLERWLREVETSFEERILPVDGAVADRWGRLMAERTLPAIDGLLAATALVHGLTFATRNVRDVARSGVSTVNPFVADRRARP